MSRGRGLSNQDKQLQTAVPGTAWQSRDTVRCQGRSQLACSWAAAGGGHCPEISQILRPGTEMGQTLKRVASQSKAATMKAEGCWEKAIYASLGVHSGSVTWHREPANLQVHCGNVPKPCLAGRCELPQSSLIATVLWCEPGPGEEVLFPYLVCRPREILVQYLEISSSFIPYYQKHQHPFTLSCEPVTKPDTWL